MSQNLSSRLRPRVNLDYSFTRDTTGYPRDVYQNSTNRPRQQSMASTSSEMAAAAAARAAAAATATIEATEAKVGIWSNQKLAPRQRSWSGTALRGVEGASRRSNSEANVIPKILPGSKTKPKDQIPIAEFNRETMQNLNSENMSSSITSQPFATAIEHDSSEPFTKAKNSQTKESVKKVKLQPKPKLRPGKINAPQLNLRPIASSSSVSSVSSSTSSISSSSSQYSNYPGQRRPEIRNGRNRMLNNNDSMQAVNSTQSNQQRPVQSNQTLLSKLSSRYKSLDVILSHSNTHSRQLPVAGSTYSLRDDTNSGVHTRNTNNNELHGVSSNVKLYRSRSSRAVDESSRDERGDGPESNIGSGDPEIGWPSYGGVTRRYTRPKSFFHWPSISTLQNWMYRVSLLFLLLCFSAVVVAMPIDMIIQSQHTGQYWNAVIIMSSYAITAIVAGILTIVRIIVTRRSLAGIPHQYIPGLADVPIELYRNITSELQRCRNIARNARPIYRNPPVQVSHPGLMPPEVDNRGRLADTPYIDVVRLASEMVASKAEILHPSFGRAPGMSLRGYVDMLYNLQILGVSRAITDDFVEQYERARFSGKLITEDQFGDFMETCRRVMMSMKFYSGNNIPQLAGQIGNPEQELEPNQPTQKSQHHTPLFLPMTAQLPVVTTSPYFPAAYLNSVAGLGSASSSIPSPVPLTFKEFNFNQPPVPITFGSPDLSKQNVSRTSTNVGPTSEATTRSNTPHDASSSNSIRNTNSQRKPIANAPSVFKDSWSFQEPQDSNRRNLVNDNSMLGTEMSEFVPDRQGTPKWNPVYESSHDMFVNSMTELARESISRRGTNVSSGSSIHNIPSDAAQSVPLSATQSVPQNISPILGLSTAKSNDTLNIHPMLSRQESHIPISQHQTQTSVVRTVPESVQYQAPVAVPIQPPQIQLHIHPETSTSNSQIQQQQQQLHQLQQLQQQLRLGRPKSIQNIHKQSVASSASKNSTNNTPKKSHHLLQHRSSSSSIIIHPVSQNTHVPDVPSLTVTEAQPIPAIAISSSIGQNVFGGGSISDRVRSISGHGGMPTSIFGIDPKSSFSGIAMTRPTTTVTSAAVAAAAAAEYSTVFKTASEQVSENSFFQARPPATSHYSSHPSQIRNPGPSIYSESPINLNGYSPSDGNYSSSPNISSGPGAMGVTSAGTSSGGGIYFTAAPIGSSYPSLALNQATQNNTSTMGPTPASIPSIPPLPPPLFPLQGISVSRGQTPSPGIPAQNHSGTYGPITHWASAQTTQSGMSGISTAASQGSSSGPESGSASLFSPVYSLNYNQQQQQKQKIMAQQAINNASVGISVAGTRPTLQQQQPITASSAAQFHPQPSHLIKSLPRQNNSTESLSTSNLEITDQTNVNNASGSGTAPEMIPKTRRNTDMENETEFHNPMPTRRRVSSRFHISAFSRARAGSSVVGLRNRNKQSTTRNTTNIEDDSGELSNSSITKTETMSTGERKEPKASKSKTGQQQQQQEGSESSSGVRGGSLTVPQFTNPFMLRRYSTSTSTGTGAATAATGQSLSRVPSSGSVIIHRPQ